MRRAVFGVVILLTSVSMAAGQARRKTPRQAKQPKQPVVNLRTEIGYKAPKADVLRSCSCNELERRIGGLRTLLKVSGRGSFAAGYPQEAQALTGARSGLDSAVGSASRVLDDAAGKGYLEQERICGEGITALNRPWSTWQPFLAENDLDSDYYRNVKMAHPTISADGDLEPQPGKGRVCRKGQWWTQDRALWAISSREGICAQESYKVHEVRAPKKGQPGHRCFDYRLK